MFVATALLYPCVLAALCAAPGCSWTASAGASCRRRCWSRVGAAALIALSQLSTYRLAVAPATPYLMVALALAGFALGAGAGARASHALLASVCGSAAVPCSRT